MRRERRNSITNHTYTHRVFFNPTPKGVVNPVSEQGVPRGGKAVECPLQGGVRDSHFGYGGCRAPEVPVPLIFPGDKKLPKRERNRRKYLRDQDSKWTTLMLAFA